MNIYFDEQKAAILKYVDDRGEELTRLLNQFKAEFDEDRRLRLEREEIIVKQLTDHEQEVAEKFEKQIVIPDFFFLYSSFTVFPFFT